MIIACQDCDTKFRVSKEAIGHSGRFVRCNECDHEWLAQIADLEEEGDENVADLTMDIPAVRDSLESLPAPSQSTAVVDAANAPESDIKLEDILSTLDKESEKANDKPIDSQVTPIKPKEEKGKADTNAKNTRQTVIPVKHEFYAKKGIVLLLKGLLAICLFFLIYLSLIYQREWIESKWPFLDRAYQFFHLSQDESIRISKASCTVIDIAESVLYADTMEVAVQLEMTNISTKPQFVQAVRFIVYNKEGKFVGDLIEKINKEVMPGDIEKIEGQLNRMPRESTFVSIDIGNERDMNWSNPSYLKAL